MDCLELLRPLLEVLLTALSLFAMGWWPCGGCGCKCECCSGLAPNSYQVEFVGVAQGYNDCDECDLLNSTFELPRLPDSCCEWELVGDEGEGLFPCDDGSAHPNGKYLCKINFTLLCSDDSELYVISRLIVSNCTQIGSVNTEAGWFEFHEEQPIECSDFAYTLRNIASEQEVCDWDSVQVAISAL